VGIGQLRRGVETVPQMRPGRTPLEVANAQQATDEQHGSDYPAYAEYRALLHLAVGLDYRWGLNSMVSANPDDHMNLSADFAHKYKYTDCRVVPIATIERLCRAYQEMVRENDAAKAA